MKTFRSRSGPFIERPHFEPSEIDRICADELRKEGLYPNSPAAIRIDRFVEKRFRVERGSDHDCLNACPGELCKSQYTLG